MRDEFEKWFIANISPVAPFTDENGQYVDSWHRAYWDLYQAGRRAGAEAMRERAANVCDDECADFCAKAIRALPID